MKQALYIGAFIIAFLTLQGCTTAVVTGAAAGGAATASVIHDRRTAGTIVEDENIEFKISSAVSSTPRLNDNSHINVTSYNGRVLLTGEVFNEQVKREIGQMVSKLEKVRYVENELVVGPRSTLSERGYDTTVSGKVRTALFQAPNLDSSRFKVVTEHGIVYLMGLVTPEEGRHAAHITSQVAGVVRVVKLFEYISTNYAEDAIVPRTVTNPVNETTVYQAPKP